MDGMSLLIAVTLVNINICCIVYLKKTLWQTMFKLLEIKDTVDDAKEALQRKDTGG